jgi:ferritin-like metal-binding protein YciE
VIFYRKPIFMPKTSLPIRSSSAIKKKDHADDLQTPGNNRLLFLDGLKDIHGAEKHQELILPLLKKAASSLKLQSVLATHLYTTYDHIGRLEQVFALMGRRIEGRQSGAILNIAHECERVIGETRQGTATRDAGLILVARKLESFEIGSYDSLAQLARTLEYDDIVDILEITLNEERDADDLLIILAENYIHPEAIIE